MLIHLFLLLFAFISLSACEKPLSEPERVDPIYSDLEVQLKQLQTVIATEQKSLEDARKSFLDLEPRDLHRKRSQQTVFQLEKKVRKLEEQELYQQLLLQKRLNHVRKIYIEHYKSKKPWPNPEEIKAYRIHQRLNNASRNWSDRVPKLADRQKSYQKPKTTANTSDQEDHKTPSGDQVPAKDLSSSSTH